MNIGVPKEIKLQENRINLLLLVDVTSGRRCSDLTKLKRRYGNDIYKIS